VLDRECAVWLYQAFAWRWVVSALAVASRLGNGLVWYTLVVSMPFLAGENGWRCSTQMLCMGAVNLVIYMRLKHWTERDRPYVNCAEIAACAPAMDRFSFPSGHTLHAVAFSVVLSSHYPAFAPLTWSFAALIALSRVVLGLHYPTDVAAGALIGLVSGWATLAIY
jgi:undecaprenyl-diphosphatase